MVKSVYMIAPQELALRLTSFHILTTKKATQAILWRELEDLSA